MYAFCFNLKIKMSLTQTVQRRELMNQVSFHFQACITNMASKKLLLCRH